MPLPVGAALVGLSAVFARFLVPYIVIRVLWSLGVTVATFVGADIATDYLIDAVRGYFSGLPASVFDIVVMAGGFDALEIILACFVAAVQIRQLRGAFRSISLFGSNS